MYIGERVRSNLLVNYSYLIIGQSDSFKIKAIKLCDRVYSSMSAQSKKHHCITLNTLSNFNPFYQTE